MPVLSPTLGDFRLPRVGLGPHEVLIGRLPTADIRIQDPLVSLRHAAISPSLTGGYTLRDLGSRNGTLLNGRRISEEQPVMIGDRIQVGKVTIIVEPDDPRVVVTPAGRREPNRDFDSPDTQPATEPARRPRVSIPSLLPPRIEPRHPPLVDAVGEPKVEVKVEVGDLSYATVRLGLDSFRDAGFAIVRDEDDRLSLVWRAGEQLNRLTERKAIFDAVMWLVAQAFAPARAFVLAMLDDGTFERLAANCEEEAAPSRSIAQEAVSTRSAVLSKSIADDIRFKTSASLVHAHVQTALAAPLLCRGDADALIYVDRQNGRPFSERDLRLLGLIANHAAAALDNVALLDELRERNAELARADGELRVANDALSRWSRELESKVAERTAEVERKSAEIARLAAQKDELLGIAAHDIRGPLTVILPTLEMARQSLAGGDVATLDQDLGVVEDATRKMVRMVSDLLDLKAIEAGVIHLDPIELDAQRFLASSTALGQLQARRRQIRMEVACEPGLKMWGDPKRIEQALGNLVANALKFSHEGGAVTVSAKKVEEGVEVRVVDTGPGIAPEELERLFRPFEQGESGKRVGGSGLGLAIARKLVELHGGRIRAESRRGQGSIFAFVIPPRPSPAP